MDVLRSFGQANHSSIKHCSQNLLLCEFVLVLRLDAETLNLAKLLLLDGLNLEAVVFELLSNFLALFKVIESVLLLDIVVLGNLSAHNIGVVSKLVLALLFQFALLLLVFLLAVDDAQEIITFSFGLCGKSVLTLVELLLTGNFKLSSLTLHTLLISNLLSASLALTLFEGTLGTESIDLRLSISSLLLHFTETGNLLLLLFLDAAFFKSLSNLTLNFLLIVTDNLLLLIELLLS